MKVFGESNLSAWYIESAQAREQVGAKACAEMRDIFMLRENIPALIQEEFASNLSTIFCFAAYLSEKYFVVLFFFLFWFSSFAFICKASVY